MTTENYGSGTYSQLPDGSWRLRIYAGKDPATGKPRQPERRFRGTETAAKKALRAFQAEFDAGKIDEAIAVLLKLPDSDPRHNEALVRIEKMKSSAAPTPVPAAPSEAALDEMRVAGFTAVASSRYIDAVKNLDPVVKARIPEIASMTPANGSHGVALATSEIRITFTRPMRLANPKGIHWQSQAPLSVGEVKLSEDKKTAVFAVGLAPGQTYRFRFTACVSEDGYSLIPTVLTFTTSK